MSNGNVKSRLPYIALMAAVITAPGCDLLDPTEVVNPTVTEADFIQTRNAAASWARGVERQLAITVNQVVMGAEVASDNLFNNRTLFNRVFDIPEIEPTDVTVIDVQRAVHRLREMATRGLEEVVPADPNASPETVAQLHFARGYSSLLAGELFVSLPTEAGGTAEAPGVHLERAVTEFTQARSLSSDAEFRAAATLAIARAQYRAGNRAAAVAAASEVRGAAPTLIRWAEFDITDGPTNQMQFAIFDSGQDEFQPLPRLDFLFPKYFSRTAGAQSPVAILKGEEAFLILAEAAISQGNLTEARNVLVELLGIVAQRPTASINDTGQVRGRRGGTWIFPNASNILVAASAQDEPRAGLVLTRGEGPVTVPVVSGTSVSAEMLEAAGAEDELLELLYLMRQEIFVVEGRRMTDLGIRLPVALDEALTNPNIAEGGPDLVARIPPFIPLDYGLNRFTYSDGDTLAVIQHNMNRVIVQNRTSDVVAPFH
ncbi:MAG: hypothetical protein EA422_04135 [Gemmatimonadales bacterium]|nr:MAG: hypothetical protein EA422_04135 [Gemmatimonadales bacterium]